MKSVSLIKKISRNVIGFSREFYFTTRFIIVLAIREGLKNPYKKFWYPRTNSISILANGPSLKDFLKEVDENPKKYVGQDFSVVNDFVNDPHFDVLKPKYCTMSDPLFFIDTIFSERGHKAMKTLSESVSWPMLLIIPHRYRNSDYLEPIRKNKNITIFSYHSLHYYGADKYRNRIFRVGLGNGEFGTVALNALYSAIMVGYKTIYMYGIDHNFFDNLMVNEKNVLCHIDSHFYENTRSFKPILYHYNGGSEVRPFKVSEFLFEKANIFRGHEILNSFANYMGASVYNCTKNSMVDAYNRK